MAGGANQGGRGKIIQGINVTPLVDIMLVLLIIFMVTAQFTNSPAVPMDLPQAAESEEVQTIFAVAVPVEGSLRVDGEPVKLGELESRVETALEAEPEMRAVIQADGDVAHRRVMSVMDELRAGGLRKVAFATAPEVEQPTEEPEDEDDGAP
jgi:biopolymer transport protein ExbD